LQGYGIGWTVAALPRVGWSDQDIRILSHGLAPAYLMKPELYPDPLQKVPGAHDDSRWYDPAFYWWWVRPSHAYNVGWVPYERCVEFHERISSQRAQLLKMSVAELGLPPIPVVSQEDYQAHITGTIQLLQTAAVTRVGLYFVLY
jgi:hypothetical protein